MKYTIHNSPVGPLLLAGDAGGLRLLNFLEGKHPQTVQRDWQEDARFFVKTIRQLEAYFAGALEVFKIALALEGSPFQLQVWDQLQRIPFGTTISYSELAERIGKPRAVRAVGGANGANPIPLLIPCHRVIGANGKLTGYGGGLEIKEKLLAHEGALLRL
jgi:methylated-DNA-[protein]-cysteine S-methyltransferase